MISIPKLNVCASVVSPAIAMLSQSTSPIHMAPRNGITSRQLLLRTLETSATMPGPGVPALKKGSHKNYYRRGVHIR